MYLSRKPRARSAYDWFVLDDMKSCLRRHLSAALIECSALSRELDAVDGDALMPALNAQFDPLAGDSAIQDCFSDGFASAQATLRDSGSQPLAVRAELPSGAAEGARDGVDGEGIDGDRSAS
jgi:hypothetical protein